MNFLIVLYTFAITQPRACTCHIDFVKLCLLSLSRCVQHWLWLHSGKIGLAVILDLYPVTAESSCINPVNMYCIQTYPKRPSCVIFLGVLHKNAITQLSLHMQYWFCPFLSCHPLELVCSTLTLFVQKYYRSCCNSWPIYHHCRTIVNK